MNRFLKSLIFASIGISLLAAFIPELSQWLILSHFGLTHLYLWQLITYIFIEPGPLSFGFFVQLAFNMYLLWIFGSSLLQRCHNWFFAIYFGAALLAGLAVLPFKGATLAGSTPPLYALLIAWTLLNPRAQLLLFFSIPIKAEWLIIALIGMTLLIDVSNAQWAPALAILIACFYAYLLTLFVWRCQSRIPFLAPFERKILRFLEKKPQEFYHHSKIFDIKSGEPILDDTQFMDAMLDRISRHGEESLTRAEKKRMKQISSRKKR